MIGRIYNATTQANRNSNHEILNVSEPFHPKKGDMIVVSGPFGECVLILEESPQGGLVLAVSQPNATLHIGYDIIPPNSLRLVIPDHLNSFPAGSWPADVRRQTPNQITR